MNPSRARLAYVGAAIAVAALLFQLFIRYKYVTPGYGKVWQIDRLTGAACLLPCRPKVQPTPTGIDFVPNPTPATTGIDFVPDPAPTVR
jgi:hypothetical protein